MANRDRTSAPELIRSARHAAGLTQAELAARAGLQQSVVARLERGGSNPTVATLERVLRATGHELATAPEPKPSSIDPTLVDRQLRMTPAERLASFKRTYDRARRVAAAGARARGDLA